METKHTPEPWEANPRGDDSESNLIFATTLANGTRRLVASVTTGADAPANRCLIAASPDLLALAQEVLKTPGLQSGLQALCAAAVAKATGQGIDEVLESI